MQKVLITGPSGAGKSFILQALILEYKGRGYKAIFIDNHERWDDLETLIKVWIKALPAEECPPGFCVITSIESPEELGGDFFRVIRIGRS